MLWVSNPKPSRTILGAVCMFLKRMFSCLKPRCRLWIFRTPMDLPHWQKQFVESGPLHLSRVLQGCCSVFDLNGNKDRLSPSETRGTHIAVRVAVRHITCIHKPEANIKARFANMSHCRYSLEYSYSPAIQHKISIVLNLSICFDFQISPTFKPRRCFGFPRGPPLKIAVQGCFVQ